jgi:Mg-chelatase subunit ChlD
MKKKRFTRFLSLSIFVHMGLLLGFDAFLGRPPRVVSFEPVPVETVILEEEPVAARLKLTPSKQTLTEKTLETKSSISVGTEARLKVGDLAGPIPKEGRFEPSLNVDSVPTLGVVPEGREGKEVVSKPVLSTLKMPPLRLSPVKVRWSDQPLPLEVEMLRVLVEAKTGGVETYSQTQKKIETPIGRSRVHADSVSELPPIPTVESPSKLDEREMTLAASDNHPKERLAHNSESEGAPKPMVPKEEPAILDFQSTVPFPVPGSEEGAAFLFVLDTSGSVKGAPLEGIKRSAWEFVELMRPNDRAGIVTFNDNAQLVRPPTSEKQLLRREISNIRTSGKLTVLFDALIQAISMIQREDRKSKFLILFSDGKDEGSQSTLQKVIQNIRHSGVSILCVGYSRVEKKHLDTLENIAAEGGGIFADAPRFHDIVMLYKAARDNDPQEGETAESFKKQKAS